LAADQDCHAAQIDEDLRRPPCFGYKDDFRQLLSDGDNPMITGSLRNTFRSIEELSSWAAAYGSRKGCD
jgi:hypothetical protein